MHQTIFSKGLYDGDMMSSDEILRWLTTRVTEDHIQLVSDTILEDLIEKVPYVACLFTGKDRFLVKYKLLVTF